MESGKKGERERWGEIVRSRFPPRKICNVGEGMKKC